MARRGGGQRGRHARARRRGAGVGPGRGLRGDRFGERILSASCRRVGCALGTDDSRPAERSAAGALGVGASAALSRRGGDAGGAGAALRSAVSPVAVGGRGRRGTGVSRAAGGVPGGAVVGGGAAGRERPAERRIGAALARGSARQPRGGGTRYWPQMHTDKHRSEKQKILSAFIGVNLRLILSDP